MHSAIGQNENTRPGTAFQELCHANGHLQWSRNICSIVIGSEVSDEFDCFNRIFFIVFYDLAIIDFKEFCVRSETYYGEFAFRRQASHK